MGLFGNLIGEELAAMAKKAAKKAALDAADGALATAHSTFQQRFLGPQPDPEISKIHQESMQKRQRSEDSEPVQPVQPDGPDEDEEPSSSSKSAGKRQEREQRRQKEQRRQRREEEENSTDRVRQLSCKCTCPLQRGGSTIEYNYMTRAVLRQYASLHQIPGRSYMNRQELVDSLVALH